jgi:hypothetical protein
LNPLSEENKILLQLNSTRATMKNLSKIKSFIVPLAIVLAIGVLIIIFLFTQSSSGGYYAIQLNDGEIWYGKIVSNDENFLTLDEIYHFHGENFSQLVDHDPRFQEPKQFNQDYIVSVEALAVDSPVLKAIKGHEGEH